MQSRKHYDFGHVRDSLFDMCNYTTNGILLYFLVTYVTSICDIYLQVCTSVESGFPQSGQAALLLYAPVFAGFRPRRGHRHKLFEIQARSNSPASIAGVTRREIRLPVTPEQKT